MIVLNTLLTSVGRTSRTLSKMMHWERILTYLLAAGIAQLASLIPQAWPPSGPFVTLCPSLTRDLVSGEQAIEGVKTLVFQVCL